MSFKLAPLPYSPDALAPHISAETIHLHYDKHHRGYVDKLNEAVQDSLDVKKSLKELVLTSGGDRFNFAAQIWNHDFYWASLDPDGGKNPDAETAQALKGAFGSIDDFKRELAEAATGQFGSGWAWLAVDQNGKMTVTSTSDADNPLRQGLTPLLTLDVWEHAYYVDYRNERKQYIDACLEHLLNWQHVERELTHWRDKKAA